MRWVEGSCLRMVSVHHDSSYALQLRRQIFGRSLVLPGRSNQSLSLVLALMVIAMVFASLLFHSLVRALSRLV